MTTSNFPVDKTLLGLMPRAGAPSKNPDWGLPTLREVDGEIFLEQKIEGDDSTHEDISVSRRISLSDIEEHIREEISRKYQEIDFSPYKDGNITKIVEQIEDSALRRVFLAILTFLNPRQIAIVLYLYRTASEQAGKFGKSNGVVTFDTNEILNTLGYTPNSKGNFNSRVRSQFHQDLVALHKTNMVFTQSIGHESGRDARLIIKSILFIEEFTVKNYPRKFGLDEVFLHMNGAADSYTVTLRFYGAKGEMKNAITISNDLCLSPSENVNSKHDYRLKLILYLSSRICWGKPDAGGHLYISKRTIFKHLGLFGKNKSRQNQTLWQTINQLIQEKIVETAHDVDDGKKATKVAIKLNPHKIKIALNENSHSQGIIQRELPLSS